MKNIKDIFDGDLALGSERWHFGAICKDCAEGMIGYRQAYWRADKTKLITFTRWKCGGGSEVVTQHPTIAYDYCYYHCKERGLLPWQQKK